MFGINSYILRMLCEDPFNTGGAGYTLAQIAKMTPDQVWFRLCEKDMLRSDKAKRVQQMSPMQAAALAKNGILKIRLADGRVVELSKTGVKDGP